MHDDPARRPDLAEFDILRNAERGLVLRPVACPERRCRVGRLTVAYDEDGFAWATMVGRTGAEWHRWDGHAAVAALVLRVLPTLTLRPPDGP